jgi:demethylmenaquinone methyltransferase/2-methoxy-6-polyprenyl-1,4-benzoquinol methylase
MMARSNPARSDRSLALFGIPGFGILGVMSETIRAFDTVAGDYGATCGGEQRGAAYAAASLPHVPPGLALEVGVGTGVVALGLERLGRDVVGVDVSLPMLAVAQARTAGSLVAADGSLLPFADESFDCVCAIWVLDAVSDPSAMLGEIQRVLRPSGHCLVCPTNHPAPDDVVGLELDRMFQRVEGARPDPAPWTGFSVTAERVLTWAEELGMTAEIQQLEEQSWDTTADREIASIRDKVWSAMKTLEEETYVSITTDAIRFLESLPPGTIRRRAIAEMVIVQKQA